MQEEVSPLELARKGDQEAFALIYKRYYPMLVQIARGYRLDATDAADVSQVVFMRLLQHIGDIRGDDTLGPWLAVVARREALNLLRQRARTSPVDMTTLDAMQLSDEAAAASLNSLATTEDVRRLLRRLSNGRDATAFQVVTHMLDTIIGTGSVPSSREIADACGLSHTGVTKALKRLQPQFASLRGAASDR